MLLEPDAEDEVAYELCQLLGRAILPVDTAGDPGTAFFLSHPAGEFLLTADVVAGQAQQLGLRPSVTEPAGVAGGSLPLADLPTGWTRDPQVGVAALPTRELHGYAGGHGWRWRVQPVPAAVAVTADDLAAFAAGPVTAIVLALGVGGDGSRPLEVAVERAVRDGDRLRITAALPAGYVGAPVFGVRPDAAGEIGLRCLGVLLPAEAAPAVEVQSVDGHPVATLDRVLAALPGGGERRA
ncbi:hypothetical protein TPA0907_04890 [Micromonospora humidisoli]|uniref:hypothetical protein n=1 Tax=Micromonospora sp. AKA109 TaxID=2733865 RepID=UPI0022C3E5B1|nr:hypothetical protein [Micromonospora sp. AKA109]GHJ06122.1 hypothetical protein TPA0907_04890 [Micromonospora sp. AKA109]